MFPALFLASLTAAPLLAAEEIDLAERRWIAFRDGDALSATILDLNGDRVVARIPSLGIDRAEIPLSRLSRGSAVRLLHEHEDLDSVEALTRLAETATERGLHRQAADDLARAVELAPDDAALADRWSKAREEAADAALARARRMEELGAAGAARVRYQDVVESWPDGAAAEEAATRLAALGDGSDDSAEADRDPAPTDARFSRIDRRLERGRASYRRALENPEDLGETEDLLLDAASDQTRAI
ncbi:MAG: tol-pal system YbgF family protein, partial [Planctomycetota bacterium JB042]